MTEKLTLKERAVRGYWSIVGVAGALIFFPSARACG